MSAATLDLGLHLDIPDAEYHGWPGLSQSGAKLLLDCPARYRWDMDNREEKDAYDLGHAVHAKILGIGMPVVVIPPTGRTKDLQAAHREAKEQAHAEGKTPITPEQAEQVDAMAEAVLAHDEARSLMEREGRAEVSMTWTEQAQIGWDTTDVPARGRIDWLTTNDGAPLAVDLKTTAKSTAPIAWRSSVLDYGYDIQAASYGRGYHQITGDPLPMAHVVIEKRAPYIVAVYPPMPPEYLERGTRRWLDAIDLYARCMTTDTWPGRPGLQTYPDLPTWAR